MILSLLLRLRMGLVTPSACMPLLLCFAAYDFMPRMMLCMRLLLVLLLVLLMVAVANAVSAPASTYASAAHVDVAYSFASA